MRTRSPPKTEPHTPAEAQALLWDFLRRRLAERRAVAGVGEPRNIPHRLPGPNGYDENVSWQADVPLDADGKILLGGMLIAWPDKLRPRPGTLPMVLDLVHNLERNGILRPDRRSNSMYITGQGASVLDSNEAWPFDASGSANARNEQAGDDLVRRLTYREKLGAGVYAGVWKAHDPVLDREVAVKVFLPTEYVVSDALDHARALARIRHPNVVVVHEVARVNDPNDDSGVVDGVLMELLTGERLGERLRGPMFTIDEAERIGLAIVEGVRAIHAEGLTHADLHENNVMLDTLVGAKVIDILYTGTLAQLPTATRTQHFGRDVDSVRELLGLVLKNTDVDLGAGYVFRQATAGSEQLDVVQAAFSEALAGERLADPTPPSVLTAPQPDIRVTVSPAMAAGRDYGTHWFVVITVENHSPVKLFLTSITIAMDDGQQLFPRFDDIYGSPVQPATIESGDAHSLHLDPSTLADAANGDLSRLGVAVAKDKIGRRFPSTVTVTAAVESALLGNSNEAD